MPNRSELDRRTFLKLGGGFVFTIGGAMAGLPILDRLINVPGPDRLTREEGLTREEVREAIVNFTRMRQRLSIDPKNGSRVVRCDEPFTPPEQRDPGSVYSNQEFDWENARLENVYFAKKPFPILTARRLIPREVVQIQSWHREKDYIRNLIRKKNLPSVTNSTIPTLVVDFRSIRDKYWTQTPQSCRLVSDDSIGVDTDGLFRSFVASLDEFTDGIIRYRQVDKVTIREDEMPLTTDPNLTRQDLVDAYGRSINYQKIAELGIQKGARAIFVYAGPSAGMYESEKWRDPKTGKVVMIFGLNYTMPATEGFGLHSWSHYLEDQVRVSILGDIFRIYVGRDLELYLLPYKDADIDKHVLSMKDTTFAAAGMGSVHLPPDAIGNYQYDSPIRVRLMGQRESVDSSLWGGSEYGYLKWWISSMPREFLSIATQSHR